MGPGLSAWFQGTTIVVLVHLICPLIPAIDLFYGIRGLCTSPEITLWSGFWLALSILLRSCRVAFALLDALWRIPFLKRRRKKPYVTLRGQDVPKVDIIITACNERRDVILDTVRAACAIDYPPERCRIIVADDGADCRLQRLVNALRPRHRGLHYYARHKIPGGDHRFKAGNLNSTLEWSSSLEGGASEWIAVLDCDMMPEPDWLRVLLAHAVTDKTIGMVVPPQDFYNIPPNDILCQSTRIQFALDDPLRDCCSAVWCSGSGFLARRKAIDAIGGFPDTSLSEDILCGMELNAHGWRVILVDEPLQWGLMPDSIDGHVSQRRRWAVGTLQNALRFRFFVDRISPRQMTPAQRFQGFVYSISPIYTYIVQPLIFLLLPWCLVFNYGAVQTPALHDLRIQLFWHFSGRLLVLAKEYGEATLVSPHAIRQREAGSFWLGPVIAGSVISALLSQSQVRGHLPFVSSGSVRSRLAERHDGDRAPLNRRLCAILFGTAYFCNTVMAVNALLCFVVRLRLDMRAASISGNPTLVLLRSSISPTFRWELYASFLIPLIYAISPPATPPRRMTMLHDKASRTWRVHGDFKGVRWNRWALVLELPATFAVVWSGVALLILS